MVSPHEPGDHTQDSSPDSNAEDSHNPSDNSNMESDQDRTSGYLSDLGSIHCTVVPHPTLSPAMGIGGDFMDMFLLKEECPGSSKRLQSRPSSSSCSRSRETENQKRCHVPPPENTPNLDKPERKKKKSDRKETPSKSHSKREGRRSRLAGTLRRRKIVAKRKRKKRKPRHGKTVKRNTGLKKIERRERTTSVLPGKNCSISSGRKNMHSNAGNLLLIKRITSWLNCEGPPISMTTTHTSRISRRTGSCTPTRMS